MPKYFAPVAELVDAPDSKSGDSIEKQESYRFDPCQEHCELLDSGLREPLQNPVVNSTK